jgi:DNA-binding transcriptional ArsR family regulator
MTNRIDPPYDALEKLFHEPNRLAIMSSLLGASRGLTFADLKNTCGLTDGNLSRHLKTLEEAGAVRVHKAFVNRRPRTTVYLSETGKQRFVQYLDALEAVLKQAADKIEAEEGQGSEKVAPLGAKWLNT